MTLQSTQRPVEVSRPVAGRGRHGVRPSSPWPLILVSLIAGAGLLMLVADVGGFRPGSTVIGAAVLLAALLRLVLSDRRAGLLAVRGRGTDVVLLVTLGSAIIVLAGLVPTA